MVDGIVLAGGYSSRMELNKMALPFHGEALIAHTIRTMSTVCDNIIVVTGHHNSDDLVPDDAHCPIRTVNNPAYSAGMFTSVKRGFQESHGDVVLIPGDYPLVKPSTYEVLLQADGLIRVPTYHGKRGHPIYLDGSLRKALLAEPDNSNLKTFRDRHTVTYVAVDDPYILFDIDDMFEYQKLLDIERMD